MFYTLKLENQVQGSEMALRTPHAGCGDYQQWAACSRGHHLH